MTPIGSKPPLEPDSAVTGGSAAELDPDAPEGGDFDLITDSSLSYVSLEVLLAELLERVRDILDADTAAILLLDQERNVLRARAARGIEEEVRQGVQIPVGRGFAGRIAAERRPIIIDDVDHSDVLNPLLRLRGIRSLLGVPLLVEGRVTGVLHVGTLTRRQFGDADVRLLQLAADRAALAIDNAQLSEQRALTEVLQRILLPDALPEIPGLRFSAKYLPAAMGLKVGGDWYDVFPLEDGRVAFVTGDVVGRGVSAAAVMAEIRTALRAYLIETPDPLRVVNMLNGLLMTMGGKRSATLMLMALDLETGGVVAVNAGHPPALLLLGDGRCEYVAGASGPPLGVTWSARYAAQEVNFPAGSSMLLYTDGLIERRGESIDDGLDRLATALAETPYAGPGTLADTVFQRVLQEMELEDDVALLAIEALPLGDHLAFTLETRPTVLAGLRRALGRWLAGHGLSDQEVFDVALAVSEAAANAIEHAYGPGAATFDVECRSDSGEIAITVTDSGSWRPLGRRQRGRGLDIMGKLVDELQVRRSDTGTRVRLVKRVGR
jgi:serine phosphatase RsbU (regulator of sigma subunit)/anti-sigma regulatory factor (Ser/Thr protein kinase)